MMFSGYSGLIALLFSDSAHSSSIWIPPTFFQTLQKGWEVKFISPPPQLISDKTSRIRILTWHKRRTQMKHRYKTSSISNYFTCGSPVIKPLTTTTPPPHHINATRTHLVKPGKKSEQSRPYFQLTPAFLVLKTGSVNHTGNTEFVRI